MYDSNPLFTKGNHCSSDGYLRPKELFHLILTQMKQTDIASARIKMRTVIIE